MALSPMVTLFLLEMFFSRILDDVTNISSKIDGRGSNLCKFVLYTPEHPQQGRRLMLDVEDSFSTFNASRDTKVIIHGFVDRILIADWMHDMKDEFLKFDQINVIEVDWSAGNLFPYSRAANNTEKVGKELSALLRFIQNKFEVSMESFHLIGHSLGSHIAAFVGEHVKPIGRITGLDPAMPLFHNIHRSKRLDTADAIFVDVIHTHGDVLGMVKSTGHVDFYPNGGKHQAGCTLFDYTSTLLHRDLIGNARHLLCSHMRSVQLYIESINPDECRTFATHCTSWEDYENGSCTEGDVTIMGYHVDRTRKYNTSGYYFYTAPNSPFCVHEYRIKLFVSGNSSAAPQSLSFTEGTVHQNPLQVTLLGKERDHRISFSIDKRNEDSHHSYVITSRKLIDSTNLAKVKWTNPSSRLRPEDIPMVTRLEVTSIHLPVQRLKDQKIVFCAAPDVLNSDTSSVTLSRTTC